MGREIFALFCLMGNTNCTSWLFCEARYLARAQPHLLARVPQHLGLQPVKLVEGNLCWFAAGEFPVFDLVCCSFCPEVFLSYLSCRKKHWLLLWSTKKFIVDLGLVGTQRWLCCGSCKQLWKAE